MDVVQASVFELVDEAPFADEGAGMIDLGDDAEVQGMVTRWELEEIDFTVRGEGDCHATRLRRHREREGLLLDGDELGDGSGASAPDSGHRFSSVGERVTRPPQNPGGDLRPGFGKGLGRKPGALAGRMLAWAAESEGAPGRESLGAASARARMALAGGWGEGPQAIALAARFALSFMANPRTNASLGQRGLPFLVEPSVEPQAEDGGLFPSLGAQDDAKPTDGGPRLTIQEKAAVDALRARARELPPGEERAALTREADAVEKPRTWKDARKRGATDPPSSPAPASDTKPDKAGKAKKAARRQAHIEAVQAPEGPARPLEAPGPCDCNCHGRESGREGALLDDARRRFFPAWVDPGAGEGGADVFRPAEWLPCGCTDRSARACADARYGTRVLGAAVDTLHLSVAVNVPDALLEKLKGCKHDAQNGGGVVKLLLAGVMWEVSPGSGGKMYPYLLSSERGDLAISSSKKNKSLMALRFELRSVFMWNAGVSGAWRWCEEIARTIHEHEAHRPWCATFGTPPGECKCGGPLKPHCRVTRADLCVDVSGPLLGDANVRDFVMRASSKTRHNQKKGHGVLVASRRGDAVEIDDASGGVPRSPDPQLHIVGDGACLECDGTGRAEEGRLDEHWSGLRPTGWSFGKSEISARIYDKTREIRSKSRDKVWLFDVWATRGWVATETVWRVECELKRQGLKELCDERTLRRLNIDTLEGFVAALPSIWGYVVGGVAGHVAWMKWVTPNPADKRRARWDPRPEWRAIQKAGPDFATAKAFPLVRIRRRAAKWSQMVPQVLGCAATAAACAGKGQDGQYLEPLELEAALRDYLKRKDAKSWQDLCAEKAIQQESDAAAEHAWDFEREAKMHAKLKAERAAREKVSA